MIMCVALGPTMELDKLTVSLGHTKVLYGLMYTHTHTHTHTQSDVSHGLRKGVTCGG